MLLQSPGPCMSLTALPPRLRTWLQRALAPAELLNIVVEEHVNLPWHGSARANAERVAAGGWEAGRWEGGGGGAADWLAEGGAALTTACSVIGGQCRAGRGPV